MTETHWTKLLIPAALAIITVGIVSTGFYFSYDVRARRTAYYAWRDEEIRKLEGTQPTRAAVLRDDLLEAMYFDGQGVEVYFSTMAAALIPVMCLFVACGLQTGSTKVKL